MKLIMICYSAFWFLYVCFSVSTIMRYKGMAKKYSTVSLTDKGYYLRIVVAAVAFAVLLTGGIIEEFANIRQANIGLTEAASQNIVANKGPLPPQ